MAEEKRLIDVSKAQAVLVNMAEHLMEAGNPEMVGAVGYAAEVIGKQHTVDAVEVVHGRWIENHLSVGYGGKKIRHECSICGGNLFGVKRAYCPDCGAKMLPQPPKENSNASNL